MYNQYKDLYNKTPYDPLIPDVSDPTKLVYKFNSVTHLISWIQHLDKTFKRGRVDATDSQDGSYGFTLSNNLEDAYQRIRETVFDTSDTDILQSKIRNLKHSSKFAEEGYEIEIPEHIAGGDKVWLENTKRRSVTKIIDDPIFIESVYTAYKDAQTCKHIGIDVLKEIYSRGVIPRKMIILFANERSAGSKDVFVFVDVDFRDLNGIAKALHPSTFRRVIFRLLEIFPDLARGYGHPFSSKNEKGYFSIEQSYSRYSGSDNPKDEIRKEIDIVLNMQTNPIPKEPPKKVQPKSPGNLPLTEFEVMKAIKALKKNITRPDIPQIEIGDDEFF